jgi:uroporphyrinogen III methyltransferase/synthase
MSGRLRSGVAPASGAGGGGDMLVVIAHGSHDPQWCMSVERAIQAAQVGLEPRALRLAYMDCAAPSLRSVVADAARAGVTRVRVLPLFLAAEGHVERDVRPLVEAVRKAHPSLAMELLPPLGQFPQFQEALRAIVRNGRGTGADADDARPTLLASEGVPGTTETRPRRGVVYLVGAGPGDPGLITRRGIECLQEADIVLYDYLVNPALLEHARPTAELVPLGRRTTGRGLTPEQISRRMIEAAGRGRTVVRLKAGDPSVFARGADEEGALRQAGIPFEIVPGITAGLAVAAYCEIPITHHDEASAVALVTGRERDEKAVRALDYGALASFPGTLVFYMGVTRAEEWSAALIAGGKPPETPVAIVRWCTRAEQQRVRCTLGTVAAVIAKRRLRPPAVIVVGEVVGQAPERAWFDARPLFGVRVLVPGTPAASQALRDRLTQLGADAVIQPAIRIAPPADWASLDTALLRLDQYDWLVFSSAHAVDGLLGRLLQQGGDVRRLGRLKVAAIGEGAADRLACYHVRADLVPGEFVAESLARAIAGRSAGTRVLLVRSSRGSDALAGALAHRGAVVDRVAAYRSSDVITPDPDVAAALAAGEIRWIAITSSAAARSLARLYGDALRRARLATIGSQTSATLRALGHRPAVEASPRTTAGLVDAILRAEASGA